MFSMKLKKNKSSVLTLFSVFLFASLALKAQNDPEIPDFTKQKVLHMVSTAHFDSQWNWTVQTSINNYLYNTLKDNFRLIEKYPTYVFNFEGAIRYMWMKDYYPDDYLKVKDYIDKGRWHISGSSLDAGDVLIPSPEAIMRLILLGQDFFKKEFGKTSSDIFLPDCFGFGYALPSISAHCGLKGFSTSKLTWGSPIPFSIGMWEGVDGSKFLAKLNPGSVGSKVDNDFSNDSVVISRINEMGKKSGLFVDYKYYGTGDIGGAPPEESVAWLEKSVKSDGPVKVIAAPSDLLCKQLTPEQMSLLPQYNGEFLLSVHGTGCYTSQAFMKRINRKNELLADAAERASVVADWLGAAKYPKEKLNDAWIRFLWHQMHDDLTGTSTPEAYHFSWNDELISHNQFESVLTSATGGIACGLDTRVKGIPLVVYNSISVEREDIVEATINLPLNTRFIRVLNPNGKEVPSQIIKAEGNLYHILFSAQCPANGFAVYDVQTSETPSTIKNNLVVTDHSLENRRYKVTIDKNGDISSIIDKIAKKELLNKPCQLELFNDTSYYWPAWEIQYSTLSHSRGYVKGIKEIKVEESGPARISVKIVREADGSLFTQYVRLSDGDSGNRVDIDNVVDWKSLGTLLKATFPVNFANPKARYDLGLGTIERSNNTSSLYEVPAQQWADITSPTSDYGVTIMNDSKYGWDKPDDNTLRLTLFHNPSPAHMRGRHFMAFQDFGKHYFSYSLAGHKGDWKNETTLWQPARFNQPLVAFQTYAHEGDLGKSFSFAKVNSSQVAIRAIKKAENSDEIVIRLQELKGEDAGNVVVSFAAEIASAREINGVEEPVGTANIENGHLNLQMKSYQPRTFAITLEKPAKSIDRVINQPLSLKHNLRITSSDYDRTKGNFDGKGNSFPQELFPNELNSEGVLFKLGSGSNAVECRGDTISLPSGDFNKLYFLAAANEDTEGTFLMDNEPVTVGIQSYTGFIGQWFTLKYDDHSRRGEPKILDPFIKRDNIAWVGTHRHSYTGINEAYVFCYMYKYAIEIPRGAKTVILPENDKIKIMAMTLSKDLSSKTKPASSIGIVMK